MGARQLLGRRGAGVRCEILAFRPTMADRRVVIGPNKRDYKLSWGSTGRGYRPSGRSALDQAQRQGWLRRYTVSGQMGPTSNCSAMKLIIASQLEKYM